MKPTPSLLTGAIYFHAALSGAALAPLLAQTFAAGAFWLGTGSESAELARVPDSATVAALPTTWRAGRAFDPTAEVRWAWVGAETPDAARYQVWLLGENLPTALVQSCRECNFEALGSCWEVAAAPRSLYLWGQYTADLQGWVEVRTPRVFHYPVPVAQVQEKSFAGVGHLLYRAPNGAVQFTRLTVVESRPSDK